LPICLTDCLEIKLDALREFLAITESLNEKCDLEDPKEITPLLDRREELIDTINLMDEQIRKNKSDRTYDQGVNIETIHAIQGVLTRIKILDDHCLSKVTSLRERTGSELLEIRRGIKAIHSYAGKTVLHPKFLDLRR
jgi:hypothetical protein